MLILLYICWMCEKTVNKVVSECGVFGLFHGPQVGKQ